MTYSYRSELDLLDETKISLSVAIVMMKRHENNRNCSVIEKKHYIVSKQSKVLELFEYRRGNLYTANRNFVHFAHSKLVDLSEYTFFIYNCVFTSVLFDGFALILIDR